MMTVKQIADKTGVSKTTVTRYLKRMENTIGTEFIKHNTSTDELGRMVISEELAEKLQETILKQNYKPDEESNMFDLKGFDESKDFTNYIKSVIYAIKKYRNANINKISINFFINRTVSK